MANAVSRPKPPPLFRTYRMLGRASTVVSVLAVIWIVVTLVSGIQFAQGLQKSNIGKGTHFSLELTGSSVQVSTSLAINNSGYLAASGLSTTLAVYNATGLLLGQGGSSGLTIPGGGSAQIPFSFAVNISAGNPAVVSLLTHPEVLALKGWVNLTYGYLFPVSLVVNQTYDWGAPFQGLALFFGSPYYSDGHVIVNVTVAFSNQAPIQLNGTLALTLTSSSQATCGTTSFPVSLVEGARYNHTSAAVLIPSCSLSGGSVVGTFSGPGFSFDLPSEPIP